MSASGIGESITSLNGNGIADHSHIFDNQTAREKVS